MAGNTTVKSKCKGSRKRKKEKRVPRQGFMQMGNNRERERSGLLRFVTRRTISRYEKKKDMFNRVSLAILHYRLHERIHCRPENSRLQLEYSLAICFVQEGCLAPSTRVRGVREMYSLERLLQWEKKTRSGFTDSKRIQWSPAQSADELRLRNWWNRKEKGCWDGGMKMKTEGSSKGRADSATGASPVLELITCWLQLASLVAVRNRRLLILRSFISEAAKREIKREVKRKAEVTVKP
jgi:hypothetical protein